MGYWDDKAASLRAEAEENARKKKAMTTLESGAEIRDLTRQGLLDTRNRVAPQAGNVRVGNVAQGQGATIDTAQQGQFRMGQLMEAGRLRGVADGTTMGAGQMAVRQEGNRAVAQQQAMARAARGSGAALAARGAAANSANIGLNVAGQAAQAQRADAAQASATMSSLLGQGREQDIGLATGQAGLSQQMNLANLDARNQRVFQQAGLDQSTSLANMQSKLSTMGMNDQAQIAYLSQLFGVDAAEMQARLEQERIRVAGQANRNNLLGNLLQAGGAVAAAKLGQPGAAAAALPK